MDIILSIKNKLIEIISKKKNNIKNESAFNIPNDEVKMDTDPFLLSAEKIKKIAQNYDSSKFSISYMNDWMKYKNRYSRILIQAKRICRQLKK